VFVVCGVAFEVVKILCYVDEMKGEVVGAGRDEGEGGVEGGRGEG
jgi:hypothetical protein